MPVPNIVIDRCGLLISWYMCMEYGCYNKCYYAGEISAPDDQRYFFKEKIVSCLCSSNLFPYSIIHTEYFYDYENALVKKTIIIRSV